MPEPQPPSGKQPDTAQLDKIFAPPDAENFTEATIRYEAPGTRQARETKEAANAAQERLFTRLRLTSAGALLFGFFFLGIYLLALKPNATEEQRQYAMTLLTSIASGTTGYAFGKRQDKPDKE